jgi:hypothetical protein
MKNLTLELKKFDEKQLSNIYYFVKDSCMISSKTKLAKVRLKNLLELVVEEIIQIAYFKE